MKIALIGTTAACVLGFRASLIRALAGQGHEVYAFALDYDEASREKVRLLGAIPVDYRFSRSGLDALRDIIDTCRLSRLLKEIGPDLVFTYFSKPVIFGTFAAFFAGVKRRVAMLEGLGYSFTEQPDREPARARLVRFIQVLLYRLAFPMLERLIMLNPDDYKDLVGRYRLRVREVTVLGGIGVDLSLFPFAEPPSDPVRFLFVGRLLAEKGIREFSCAARIVRQRYPDARFIVLGEIDRANPGALKEQDLHQLIAEGTVEYPGQVGNVRTWIEQASVFVLPSYREGVPRSTQEAMAVGRPVITTDVPGCRETVVNGVNGFLVPPWSARAVAEKMIFFLENRKAIASMGRESRRLACEKFDAREIDRRLIQYLTCPPDDACKKKRATEVPT